MCDSPFYKRPKGYLKDLPFPCGKCPPCKRKRVQQWVFRMKQEDKISSSAYFITLTYDTRHVPISKNGFMTLDKSDFQKFMKRLRKKHHAKSDRKLVYYCAGEYGEQTKRPHYHAIIFNIFDIEDVNFAWNLGDVHVGSVSGSSIAYCVKYIDKDKVIPQHVRDDRIKEFSLMSKGIGKNYMTDAIKQYHKNDLSRNYVTDDNGNIVAMPRYYRNHIYTEREKEQQRRIITRKKNEEERQKVKIVARRTKGKMTKEEYEYSEKMQRLKQFNKRRKIRK
jgi:hypothetical protein